VGFAYRYFAIHNADRIAKDVVASCETCQRTKYYTRPTVGVQYYELPKKPGRVVSIDIFGPLPKTGRGLKYVLVCMDQFSKYTKLYGMKNQKAETIMEILEEEYFTDVGKPKEIVTDNGGQFITNK
jgi:hypothetical protein